MAAAVNPQTLNWADPRARVDGSVFGASDLKAYELGVGGSAAGPFSALFTLPVAYGVGQSPIPDAVKAVTGRSQWLALRTLDTAGGVSAWTNGLEVTFVALPLPPAAFAVA